MIESTHMATTFRSDPIDPPRCPSRASLVISRHPLAYGECWMPKAEGPEKD
jgi:hypothetical protein